MEKNLQRVQVWLAILTGTVTFIVGAYNTKNIFFPKKEISPTTNITPSQNSNPSPIRSAIEDVGADLIRKWGKPQSPSSSP